jgi:hypothetical protein
MALLRGAFYRGAIINRPSIARPSCEKEYEG